MALKYAGVAIADGTETPFPDVMQTWAEWVEDNISMTRAFPIWEQLNSTLIRAQPLTRGGYTPEDPIRLYTLVWPSGASRWAHLHCIVTGEQLIKIRKAAPPPGPSTLQMTWYDRQTEKLVDYINPSMYYLPARPLDQLKLGGPALAEPSTASRELWLLSLVDERYYWWLKNTGDITITEGTTTWAQVFTSLGSALGVSITTDTISASYLKPSAAIMSEYEYVPPMLDAVAYNVGQRIVRSLSGTVKSQSATAAAAVVTSNLALKSARSRAGGGKYASNSKVSNDLNGMVPATVQIIYPKIDCNLLTGAVYSGSTTTLAALALPDFGTATGISGKTKTFRDTCTADFTAGAGPVNASELTALTQQHATDYYRWQSMAVDIAYVGIVGVTPEGQSDQVEWTHREGDISTRILPGPVNDLTFDLMHASSVNTITKSGLVGYYGDWAFPGNIHMDAKRSWKPTAVTLASDQNDYAAPTTPYLRVNATSDFKFTGFANGNEGLVFFLINKGTAIITLAHQNTGSIAANRLTLVGGKDDILNPSEACLVIYDCVANTWYVNKYNPKVESVSTATISADQNNYPEWKTQVLNATVTADVNITGIAPTQNVPGSLLEFLNGSTTGKVATFKNESASSTAANRINTPYGYDINVPPKSILTLKYNNSTSRWNPVAQYCCGGQLIFGGKTFQVAATDTWSADKNDYAWPNSTLLEANVSSAMNLTGVASTGNDGQVIEIQNAGSNYLTIKHESGSSSAANQFSMSDSTDMIVKPKQTAAFKYNAAATKWWALFKGTGGAGDADRGCKAYNSGTQTLTAGAAASALTADSEEYDTDNFHDTGSNTSRQTFATGGTGRYVVTWSLKATQTFSGVDKAPNWLEVFGKLTGATEVQGSRNCVSFWRISALPVSTATAAVSFELDHNCMTGSFMVNVTSTSDYLEMFADPSAVTLNVAISNFTFAVHKVNRAANAA